MRLLLALLAVLAPLAALGQPQVERVEPSFWWVGMAHPELQVLVHGAGIGESRVSMTPHAGVTLDRVVAVENPNYLFLMLTVGDDARPGTLSFQFARADGTTAHAYELRPRSADRDGAQGFSSEDVIYLMMPDRFANGDVANDSIPGMLEGADRSDPNARQGGDFAGVRQHLDYIADLGMTAIWFTPVFENDMTPEYGAYHGYAATDMYRVDPRFGTTDEFVALVEACHQRGLKVIMDMIHNHVGDRHWWMADLPTVDWVHSFERYGQTNYAGAAVIDPYAAEHDIETLVNGWFVREMPDLNQDNDLLAQYLLQNTVWWIERTGIDGIRMDTYFYPDKHYMARWVRHVLDEFPAFNIVGESWVENVPHEAYWQRGFRAHPDGYESHLPSVTDFPFSFAARGAFSGGGVRRLYDVLSQDHVYPEPNRLVTFLDNHDLPRVFSELGEDEGAFRMAYAFLMTTRGIPQVYYGTELAMPNGPTDAGSDGYKRTPMPGGWPGDDRSVFTEDGRTERENRAFETVRALTRWRRDAGVVHHGRLTQFVPRDEVYVFFRWDDDETVMVVLNAAAEARTLDLDRFQERILDHTSGRDVATGEVYRLDRETLTIPARTALVLELAP